MWCLKENCHVLFFFLIGDAIILCYEATKSINKVYKTHVQCYQNCYLPVSRDTSKGISLVGHHNVEWCVTRTDSSQPTLLPE